MILETITPKQGWIPKRPVLSALGNDLYWQYMAIKNPKVEDITFQKDLIFAHGNAIERAIIECLIERGIKITHQQKEIPTGLHYAKGEIKGKCDGILDFSGRKLIFEVKSFNNDEFNKFDLSGSPESNGNNLLHLYNNHFNYFVQPQMYMHYLATPETLMFLYNKNNSRVLELYFGYDKAHGDYHHERLQRLILHLETDEPPAFEYTKDDPRNKYNPYLADYDKVADVAIPL